KPKVVVPTVATSKTGSSKSGTTKASSSSGKIGTKASRRAPAIPPMEEVESLPRRVLAKSPETSETADTSPEKQAPQMIRAVVDAYSKGDAFDLVKFLNNTPVT